MAGHRISLGARFWRKVERGRDCWTWVGATRLGRGAILVGGRVLPARRVAWELAFGRPPPRRHVLTTCGNANCVRPGHLRMK